MLAILGYGGVRAFQSWRADQEQQQAESAAILAAQQKTLEESGRQLELLKERIAQDGEEAEKQAEELAKKVEEEQRRRLHAEQQQEAVKQQTQKKIAELEQRVAESKKNDITRLVEKWRTRVTHIECTWVYASGAVVRKNGSGFLFGTDLIATNRHVVEELGGKPSRCLVQLPDDPQTIVLTDPGERGRIVIDEKDFALIRLPIVSPYIQRINMLDQNAGTAILSCKNRASTGDQVVILGYPAIGTSGGDITATEGIVSGYEDFYYVTSAKLERGNSGGAAILVNGDCYLGIPTFVRAGGLESLGRILDFSKVIKP